VSYTFRRAVREKVPLIIGLSGGTGSGKTFSAMRMAKGMSHGKPFCVIDTENGRASHYADQFTFDVLDLHAPFSPDRYTEAIAAADKQGYPVIVIDSMSHVWAGEGGVLDWQEDELFRMAKDDYQKRESCKMAAWIKPKMAHKHMMQTLLQVKAHLILCFRAEEKIEMVRSESGRMEVRKKDTLIGKDGWVPICEKNVPFEATCSFLLLASNPGIPHPIKLQEQHKPFFKPNCVIDDVCGEQLAKWANGNAVHGNADGSHEGRTLPSAPDLSHAQPSTLEGTRQAPAPKYDLFEHASAIADYEAVIADGDSKEDLQKTWDEIVKDARINTAERTKLYQQYQRKVKALK
jgi:hypothetical protein